MKQPGGWQREATTSSRMAASARGWGWWGTGMAGAGGMENIQLLLGLPEVQGRANTLGFPPALQSPVIATYWSNLLRSQLAREPGKHSFTVLSKSVRRLAMFWLRQMPMDSCFQFLLSPGPKPSKESSSLATCL